MSERTMKELQYKQRLPLEVKVKMTQQRIREWIREYGTDGVYVSFSGGKDSTVLLHIVRDMYPNVPAVFVDTGLEYPEIREFVRTFDNVEWIRPKMNFKKVIETYGYPFISKEMSSIIGGGQRALQILESEGIDVQDTETVINQCARRLKKERGEWRKLAQCLGALTKENEIKMDIKQNEKGTYSDIPQKYKFLINAPFMISDRCCYVMKKTPVHEYNRVTNRMPITAQMASESRLRERAWMKNGCNAFDAKYPISNPMSFWTDQDVLKYIKDNDIKIASIYGDVVYVDDNGNQYDEVIYKTGVNLCTTWMKRTGCMFCGYGCQLEKKEEGRFVRMKQTHPKQYEYIMRSWEKGGLGFKEIIDWINENSDLDIGY